ncbi:hypothetical protein [Streptomyces sp. NPDC003395]
MSGFQAEAFDQYRIKVARRELAIAEGVDMGDEVAMAGVIGTLTVVVRSLLDIVDQPAGSAS